MEDISLHGISEGKFQVGYFWAAHKLQIKKAMKTFLIIADLALGIFFVYQLVLFFIWYAPHQEMMKNFPKDYTDFAAIHERTKPKDLTIGTGTLLSPRKGEYDVIFEIANPNPNFLAREVVYHFQLGNTQTKPAVMFVYPSESKFAYELRFTAERKPENVAMVLDEVHWLRWEEEKLKPENIVTDNAKLFSPRALSGSGTGSAYRVGFEAQNKTPFDFWSAGFTVALLRGNRPVAMQYIEIADFLSYERRMIEVGFSGSTAGGASIKIIPELNFSDRENYRPLEVRFQEEDEAPVPEIYSKELK